MLVISFAFGTLLHVRLELDSFRSQDKVSGLLANLRQIFRANHAFPLSGNNANNVNNGNQLPNPMVADQDIDSDVNLSFLRSGSLLTFCGLVFALLLLFGNLMPNWKVPEVTKQLLLIMVFGGVCKD